MTIDERLQDAGERLSAELRQVPVPQAPRRRSLPLQALTAAAAVVMLAVVFGVVTWLLSLSDRAAEVAGEAPATTRASPESITRRPQELVPTGVHLLSRTPEYLNATADGDGFVWAAGWEHVARIDPDTGDIRVWDQRDDAAFASPIMGLAPARGGGVWLIQEDHALRWFDGERFLDVVETRSLPSDDGIEAVVEASDGTLFASLPDRGVFHWDGSSWHSADGQRPSSGAGALAMDEAGALWVGNLELIPGEGEQPDRSIGRGVSRYDGERWETLTAADAGVLSGVVRTIEPLADGTLLAVTDSGIARFDGARWSAVVTDEPLRGGSLTVGPDGTVWVAVASNFNGAVRVAAFDGTAWSVHGAEDGLPAESRWTIATPVATEDAVFVGTGVGLYRLTGDRWTRVLPRPDDAPPIAPENAPLAGVRGLRALGGVLWVWGEDEVWRYREGRWSYYSGLPDGAGEIWDIAFGGDTLWVLAEGVFSFDGAGWTELTAAPSSTWRIEADPHTDILWLSTGGDLYRWDGSEMTNVGHPIGSDPGAFEDGYGVNDIAVTDDGTVWAAGLYGYIPQLGSLARYDDDTGAWEVIHPLGGEDIPASLLAPTPDGNLWVLLADWPGSEAAEEAVATTVVLTLARYESATGDWVVYVDLPEGYPFVMASDGDTVWMAQGGARRGGVDEIAGILRFDGRTWTTYLEDTPINDPILGIAVADDGTVWYTVDQGLHQLEQGGA